MVLAFQHFELSALNRSLLYRTEEGRVEEMGKSHFFYAPRWHIQ